MWVQVVRCACACTCTCTGALLRRPKKLHTLQISQQLWAPQISNKPSPAHLDLSLPFPPPLSFIL